MRGMDIIVHVLHEGVALCGFGRGMFPGQWPDGHKWTHINDCPDFITCKKCREVAADVRNKDSDRVDDEQGREG
jgi:hypothetical protein